MIVCWSPTAISDLDSIRNYIDRENRRAALDVANRIKESISRLTNFPLSGRSGRVPATRELVIPGTSYIAVYMIQGEEIQIASVLHGRQRWPESF
jgi:addiction module RelE/StbE family toxin